MKLLVSVAVEHDLLDVGTLLRALPLALDSVERATRAGVGETGPDGMTVQAPGVGALIRVSFKLGYADSGPRISQDPDDPSAGLPRVVDDAPSPASS